MGWVSLRLSSRKRRVYSLILARILCTHETSAFLFVLQSATRDDRGNSLAIPEEVVLILADLNRGAAIL